MLRYVKLILLVLAVVAILVASALFYGRFSSMSAMEIEQPDMSIGPLPMSLTDAVLMAPDMPFRIDTGSSVNTINQDYLRRLKAMGFDVDSSIVLTYVETAYGNCNRVVTKRYRVSLPIYAYNIHSRANNQVYSTLDTTNRVNRIDGIDFVPVAYEGEMPRLGRPFLRQFVVEYIYDINALRLHATVPEDYEPVEGLSEAFTLFSDPGCYFTLEVNGQKRDFFINTSMPRAGVLLPSDKAPRVDNVNVFSDILPSVYGRIPVVIDYGLWVRWDERAGRNVGYYADYGTHPYTINPFNFLTQDAVFDFANTQVYLHPMAERNRRLRSNDAFRQ